MSDEEISILPASGVISLKNLAKYMNIGNITLLEGLQRNGIPILKLGKYRTYWAIRLEDLRNHEESRKN